VSSAPPLPRASRPALVALSLGHGSADLCSSALFAVLPFLVVAYGYGYLQAGAFALTASLASALFQPLAGAHGDRGEAHWLLPAGLLAAAAGIAAVGFTSSYWATLLAVAVCSAGAAAYHPEGARWARRAAATHRITSDMSVFSLGGGVGYGLGPLVVAAVLAPLGLRGTPVVAVVPVAAAVLVVAVLGHYRARPDEPSHARHSTGPQGSEWRPFALLLSFFFVASGVATGLLTFVPLFLLEARAASPAAANVMTSVLLVAGAVGTLLGGILADRLGRRFVLVVPQLLLVPALALLPSLGYAAMLPAMAVIGLAINANMSTTLVLAQEYLPTRMGLATGLMIGFSGGAGGLIALALGFLGDSAGPSAVLYALALLPLAAAALGYRLPRPAAAPPGTLWSRRVAAEH
jgi:FSR family fosmidomycin resistance protein-like MFS transporter